MIPQPPAGEALATSTAAVEPSVSTSLARPQACLAPPAQFGRPTQPVSDGRGEGPPVGSSGHAVWAPGARCRPRTLSVVLDDPVAAARSLRTHMRPAELMELIIILAEAVPDVLGQRTTAH